MTSTPHRAGFLALVAACLWPAVSAPTALAAGIGFALVVGNPYPEQSGKASGWLLKAAVVGLGFGLPLTAVVETGLPGLALMGLAVVAVLLLGLLMARMLSMGRDAGVLISVGTAICGGSAIAALAPIIGARREAIAVALAVVFVLNALALYLFPIVGRSLDLSQAAFAAWSAVAIHDTSSVVGAASVYGVESLEQATILKLARALWIVPVAIAFAAWMNARGEARAASIRWPWFIGLFVLAAASRSLAPEFEPVFDIAASGARQLLVVVLFLIGSGLGVDALRRVGWRPLVHATGLWLIVSAATLLLVLGNTGGATG